MASPYTQDISKDIKQMQKANKPSISTQLTDLFKTYVDTQQTRADENITKLNTDFVFEKQAINNKIKGYNEVLELQKDVRDNYSGSTQAYAVAKANKDYQNMIANKYNAKGEEGFRVFNDYTAVGAQAYLDQRTKNIKTKLDTMFTTAQSINLGADKDSSYVDSMFTNEINKLDDSVRGKGWGILGDLVAGQGLKIGEKYDVTRQDILDRVYSDIPQKELGALAEQFQAYYTHDPQLANTLAEKVLPNIQTGTDSEVISAEKTETFLGKEIRYVESYITYTDRDGQRQTTTPTKKALNEDEFFIDAEAMTSFLSDYSPQGQKIWKEENDKGTPLNKIAVLLSKDAANFVNKDERAVKEQWTSPANQVAVDAMYNTFLVSNDFATMVQAGFGKTAVEVKQGAAKEEGFLTKAQWTNSQIQIQLRTLGINPTGVDSEMGSSEAIVNNQDLAIAYKVDASSYDNILWRDSMAGRNPVITNEAGEKIPLTEELLSALEIDNPVKLNALEDEFKNGDTTNVSSEGLYFNKGNPRIFTVNELNSIGIDTASAPIEFGYDLNEEKFVMRSTYNKAMPNKTITPPPPEAKSFYDSLKDIPFAGPVAGKMFGDELNVYDLAWVIPGTGLLKGGFTLAKIGGKVAANKAITMMATRTLRSPQTQKMIANLQKLRAQGPRYGFKTAGEYDKFVRGLTGVEQALIKTFNKSGKSIDTAKFIAEFTKIKGLQIKGYIPSRGTIVKWGLGIGSVPAGVAIENALEPEEKTE